MVPGSASQEFSHTRGLTALAPRRFEALALSGIPEIADGDDLGAIIGARMTADGLSIEAGDLLVIAQKIVSKAEGRRVRLSDVEPDEEARELACRSGKSARLCQLIIGESTEIVRVRPNLVIARHRSGLVLANAGIDRSNVGEEGSVLLLPVDADGSASAMRSALAARFRTAPAVVIADSLGRPWRRGTVGTAIGLAGLRGVVDLRGKPDMFGRKLEVSETAFADQAAAAASLLIGEAAERTPVVLLRGLTAPQGDDGARDMVRPLSEDLFR